MSQDRSKISQDWAKISQDCLKISQDWYLCSKSVGILQKCWNRTKSVGILAKVLEFCFAISKSWEILRGNLGESWPPSPNRIPTLLLKSLHFCSNSNTFASIPTLVLFFFNLGKSWPEILGKSWPQILAKNGLCFYRPSIERRKVCRVFAGLQFERRKVCRVFAGPAIEDQPKAPCSGPGPGLARFRLTSGQNPDRSAARSPRQAHPRPKAKSL